ncbi:MAG: TIGR00269 family protein [Candidatus Micrarchaeota archaeon]
MNCSLCCKKAEINLKYASKNFCNAHFLRHYERRTKEQIKKYSMFSRSHKIAIGLSGGKDSAALAHLLKKLDYNIIAVTIDEGAAGNSKAMKSAAELCKKEGIEHRVFTFKKSYGRTIDQIMKKKKKLLGKNACSYCGVLRRQLLNKAARELKCDRIATGHNLNDEIQTMMMNLFKSDVLRLSRSGPATDFISAEEFVIKVKPLRSSYEFENKIYCDLNSLPYEPHKCFYKQHGLRESMRQAINGIEEKHPGALLSALNSLDTIVPVLRGSYRKKKSKTGLKTCRKCGEVCAKETCMACELMSSL